MAFKLGVKYKVAENLTLNATHHEQLLKLVQSRMEFSKPVRDLQADKFARIDKRVYGYLVLDENDQKRETDNQKGHGIEATQQSLPMALVQLDESVTYFVEVLKTDSGLYGAIATKDKQQVANAFAATMNENDKQFNHLGALNKFLFESMKYNFGILCPNWHTVTGNKVSNTVANQVEIKDNEEIYSGNQLVASDPYNFFYDISVNPIKLAEEGEFIAEVEIISDFKFKRMRNNKEIFGPKDMPAGDSYTRKYYRERPKIRSIDALRGGGSHMSWYEVLGGAAGQHMSEEAKEQVTMVIHLIPSDHGLSKSKQYEIWRLTVINDSYIVNAEHLNNAHGKLPVGISMPWEDGFGQDSKSYAELLIPYQDFASAQLNTHQKANRKALYGLTFYNKNVVELDDNYDPVAGKIPVKADPNVDLRKAIYQINDAPDTQNTLRDVAAMDELMQKILPTDILKQVAGLERATQYQAAATVQGSNRRNLKIARVIDAQAFRPVKMMQMYNILQYQETMEILTPEGEVVEIKPQEFRENKIEFEVSDGLQGVDKMSMIMSIKEVLNTVLQSQQANQQIDVVAVINYWTSMLGDKTDFSQFKFESEIDKLPPELKDLAFQLLQQFQQQQEAGGTGGEPEGGGGELGAVVPGAA